jgi:hypothetical protein
MPRTAAECLKSGYLTEDEAMAIAFISVLGESDEGVDEDQAVAATCDFFGLEVKDHIEVLSHLPTDFWWQCRHLAVKK